MATLPASGLSRYQSDIIQIWLRVILNEAHNALYGGGSRKGFDTSNVREVVDHARTHTKVLEQWRRVLPAVLAWNDKDPPATDLNVARIRAKYYGGLYMILRPYLRIASHTLEQPPARPSTSRSSQQNSPVATVDLTELIQAACQCINAAIRSTIAFDRVGANPNSPYKEFQSTRTERLVVTSIFGTLHAQFGNILVLTAVAGSPLRQYLPSDTKLTESNLAALITQTINILSKVAPNSPTLMVDLDILENVRQLNGFRLQCEQLIPVLSRFSETIHVLEGEPSVFAAVDG